MGSPIWGNPWAVFGLKLHGNGLLFSQEIPKEYIKGHGNSLVVESSWLRLVYQVQLLIEGGF